MIFLLLVTPPPAGPGPGPEPLLDNINDRKIRFSRSVDLASESTGVTRKMIRLSSLPNDSMIKMVAAVRLKFGNWPQSVRKKRSFSYQNHFDQTLAANTLGSVWHGKKHIEEHHSLPEQVVEEILSRLPVKSLARFRCVCKSWHRLTYNKLFISLHLNNYNNSTSQLLVGTCCMLADISSMYFLQSSHPLLPPTGVSQKMVKCFPRELLGGSCNGIVCLYTNYADEFIVLWNPATNELMNPRKPRSPRIHGLCLCTVGLGFDPKTNDYKILQMVYGNPKHRVAQMELYSLRKGSWKKVDCHDFNVVPNIASAEVVCSLPFTDNRIVCAVVSPLNGSSNWEILCFDMSSERYEIIPVSPILDVELGDYDRFRLRKRHFKLFPFKESIALGIVYRVGNGSYCDIWVLSNFSSAACCRSWSKKISTDTNVGNTVPIGCWQGSRIIFQEECSKRVLWLDHDSNRMVELGVIPLARVTATEYKESLIRIKDIMEPTESRYLDSFLPRIKGWG